MEEKTIELGPIIELQSCIDTLLSGRRNIKVLEAGCGAYSYLRLPQDGCYIVGIDISEKQLQKNSVVHEKILGDIQSHELPTSEFDVIVCWWVLEHLSQPEKALKNFVKSLKEGGMTILVVPNVISIKGLITKYTPLWFHTWVYRTFFGVRGHTPFRTYLRFSISPRSLKRFAAKYGLSIEYSCLYTSPGFEKYLGKYKIINTGWYLIRQAVMLLSLGKIDVGLTDYIILLKK